MDQVPDPLPAAEPPKVKPEKEPVFLRVFQIPRTIWMAPILYGLNAASIVDSLVKRKVHAPPFQVEDDILYTIGDLTQPASVLREYIFVSRISSLPVQEWCTDEKNRIRFAYMLNHMLRAYGYSLGLRFDHERDRFFFPAPKNSRGPIRQDWWNPKKHALKARVVAERIEANGEVYWKHLAVTTRFRLMESAWYLELTPRYYFSTDGFHSVGREKTAEYKKAIPAGPNVPKTVNQALFWIQIFGWNSPVIRVELDGNALVINKYPEFFHTQSAVPGSPPDDRSPG